MLVFALALLPFTNVVLAEEVFEFDSYKDLMIYFQELGYTEESWDAGNREVHRVYLANMPSRWRGKHASEAEVKMKKEVFFRILAPLILRSNELIMQDRVRLQSISEGSEVDAAWLSDLGMRYRVLESADDPVGPEQIKRIDQTRRHRPTLPGHGADCRGKRLGYFALRRPGQRHVWPMGLG